MRYVIAVSSVISALIWAASGIDAQAAGRGRYCLTQDHTGARNCGFRTLAACVKAKTGNTDSCTPASGATGSGMGRERPYRY